MRVEESDVDNMREIYRNCRRELNDLNEKEGKEGILTEEERGRKRFLVFYLGRFDEFNSRRK